MTSFLLDTNVVSETTRPRPAAQVLDWLARQNPRDLYLTALTIGELVCGACKVKEAAKRQRYTDWIETELTWRSKAGSCHSMKRLRGCGAR